MAMTPDVQLRLAATGNAACDRRNTEGSHVSSAERAVDPRGGLATTELVVAILLAQGLRPGEVAGLMNSSAEGIRGQIARIRDKTGARSTCHAVAELMRAGVIN